MLVCVNVCVCSLNELIGVPQNEALRARVNQLEMEKREKERLLDQSE